jgi:hypothetical protein
VVISVESFTTASTYTELDDVEDYEELTVGKTSGNELKMSRLKFDISSLLGNQATQNVWIYESYIFLQLKTDNEGTTWKSQQTKLYPFSVPKSDITTEQSRMTSEQNLYADSTGAFTELVTEPTREKLVRALFTDTIHTWVNPYDQSDNEEYYGVALVNTYTDGSDQYTDATDVRYYGFENETESEYYQYIPYIDVCYKIVEIETCSYGYDEVELPIEAATIIVKDSSENYNNNSLTHGQDTDGTVYRTLIKFDLSSLSDYFSVINVNESWIHLNYLGFSGESFDDEQDRTFTVHKITSDWDESTVTWDDVEYSEDVVATATLEASRLGGTLFTIRIDSVVEEWIDSGDTTNFGVILIDSAEEDSSLVPQYADNEDDDNNHHKPVLSICRESVLTTTTPTTITTSNNETPETTARATETTKAVFEFASCTHKTVDPTEPLTIINNGTVCVSQSPIEIKYCEDKSGRCSKTQERDNEGNMVSTCECCLPQLYQRTYTFDCFGEERDIEVDLIGSCTCQTCNSNNSEMAFNRRTELKKRAEMYLAGNVPFIL